MPTFIGHALFAASLSPFRPYPGKLLPTLLVSMVCAVIPDLDVIGFEFGIRYSDMLGHRGFTHSIIFAILLGILVSRLYFKSLLADRDSSISIYGFYFLCTLSHGILDALTDGGLGVGFFIPFSGERYFFDYRPIPVSPLNFNSFFTSYGLSILKQELFFIGFISFFILVSGYYWRRYIFPEKDSE